MLRHAGEIAPGKEFTVRAEVTNAAVGQKLTLTLPQGLELADGAAVRAVPKAVDGLSVVAWKVRVTGTGTLPIRVASSTGVARTMTITLNVQQTEASGPQLFGGKR